MSEWVVLKFGGTSVKSLECWNTIEKIIHSRVQEDFKVLLVCSAMSGVSNLLQNLAEKTIREYPDKLIDILIEKHVSFAQELNLLNPKETIAKEIDSISKICRGAYLLGELSSKSHARLLSMGEFMLTKMAFQFLRSKSLNIDFINACKWLKVSDKMQNNERNHYLNALCQCASNRKLKCSLVDNENNVFITQGFVASDSYGDTVVLGRGGSDTSASCWGAMLDASRVEIWTDVPGMFTTNPHQISSARLLKNLDYDEAQELATSGAKVLHPRCIYPLMDRKIPPSKMA